MIEKLPIIEHTSALKRAKLEQLKILSPEMLKSTNVRERVLALINELPSSLQREPERHLKNVTQPFHVYALDFLERATGRFELSCRFPMFDVRLIAFCLSLPADKKLKNEYSRFIVRESLRNVLPEPVRLRKDKTNFGPNLVEAFTVRSKDWLLESYRDSPTAIFGYIDKQLIEETLERCISNKPQMSKIPDVARMITFLAVAKWMKKTGIN